MSMSNESNGAQGIQVSISNEAVAAVVGGVIEWRKIQSYDLAKVLEALERVGDKCLTVVAAVERARAARREVHVHTTEKTTKV